MPYKVELSSQLPNTAKVVIPISMGQPLQTGERLAALLDAVKDCAVTVLVCDHLNRHNTDEQTACQQGDKYLADHAAILANAKIERWQEWLAKRQTAFADKLQEIEDKSQPQSEFYHKMLKTAKKCLTNQIVDNSLKYQREEYAAILLMTEFDYLVYPQRINDGMAYLYSHFTDSKPEYIQAKLTGLKLTQSIEQVGLFSSLSKKDKNKNSKSLPLVLRMVIDELDNVLTTPEVSASAKEEFVDQIKNRIALFEAKDSKSLPFALKMVIKNLNNVLITPEISASAKAEFVDQIENSIALFRAKNLKQTMLMRVLNAE